MTRARFHAFLVTVCLLLAFPWGCEFDCAFGVEDGLYGPTTGIPDIEKGFEEPDEIEVTAAIRDIVFIWVNRNTTDDSTVVGRIIAQDVPPLLQEYELYSNSLDTSEENEWGYFGYPAPNEEHGWPPGTYRMEVSLDGDVFATKEFVVEGLMPSVAPVEAWLGWELPGLEFKLPPWDRRDVGVDNRVQVVPTTQRGRLVEVGNSRSARDVLVQTMVRESQLEVTETIATTVCGQPGEHIYLTSLERNIHAMLTTWPLPDPQFTGSVFSFLDLPKDDLQQLQQDVIDSIECVAGSAPPAPTYAVFTAPPGFERMPHDTAMVYTLPGPTPNFIDISYGIAGGSSLRSLSPESWADMIRAEFILSSVSDVNPLPPQEGTLPNRDYLVANAVHPQFGDVRVIVMMWDCPDGLTYVGAHMGAPTEQVNTPLNWLGTASCP